MILPDNPDGHRRDLLAGLQLPPPWRAAAHGRDCSPRPRRRRGSPLSGRARGSSPPTPLSSSCTRPCGLGSPAALASRSNCSSSRCSNLLAILRSVEGIGFRRRTFLGQTFLRWRFMNSFLVLSVSCLYFFLKPFSSDFSLFSYSVFILKSRSEKSRVVLRLSCSSCSSSICRNE